MTRAAMDVNLPKAMTASYWTDKLGLQPHPEGGHYRETYRCAEGVAGAHLPERFAGDRCFGTAIYFLLEGRQFSALHRIGSDELWHYYTGNSGLTVSMIAPDGELIEARLGQDSEAGEQFQAMVPSGSWFGARLCRADGFALVGCTVAPGFDFADFELGERAALTRQFPQHRAAIEALTR